MQTTFATDILALSDGASVYLQVRSDGNHATLAVVRTHDNVWLLRATVDSREEGLAMVAEIEAMPRPATCAAFLAEVREYLCGTY